MLLGLDPAPALVFGILEFIFYWYVVIALAALAARLRDRPLPGPR